MTHTLIFVLMRGYELHQKSMHVMAVAATELLISSFTPPDFSFRQ